MLRKSLVFVLLLLAGVLPAAAQRVGVVMSGGGSASAVDSAARLLPFAFVL